MMPDGHVNCRCVMNNPPIFVHVDVVLRSGDSRPWPVDPRFSLDGQIPAGWDWVRVVCEELDFRITISKKGVG